MNLTNWQHVFIISYCVVFCLVYRSNIALIWSKNVEIRRNKEENGWNMYRFYNQYGMIGAPYEALSSCKKSILLALEQKGEL